MVGIIMELYISSMKVKYKYDKSKRQKFFWVSRDWGRESN